MSENKEIDVQALRVRLTELLGSHAPGAYPHCLEERFPHVFEQVVELWGRAELDAYFDSLMTTKRPSRQGFPEAALRELFQLANLHDQLGLRGKGMGTAWDWASDASFLESRAGRE